jgi:hypothetical protein
MSPCGKDVIGDDHFMLAGEGVDTDQRHRRRGEAEFFADFACNAGRRRPRRVRENR